MKENDGWLTRESANQIRMLAKQLYDKLGQAGPELSQPLPQPSSITSPAASSRLPSPVPSPLTMLDQERRLEEEEDPHVEDGFDFTQREKTKEQGGDQKRRAGTQGGGSGARKRVAGPKTEPIHLPTSEFVIDRVEELMRQLERGQVGANAGDGDEGQEGKDHNDDPDDFELLE